MSNLLLSPVDKKSIVEKEYFRHGSYPELTIVIETLWRWGEFSVTLDDHKHEDLTKFLSCWNDQPYVTSNKFFIEEELKFYFDRPNDEYVEVDSLSDVINVEYSAFNDGSYDADEIDTIVEGFVETKNEESYMGLEDEGWEQYDSERIIIGKLKIT